MASTTRQQVIDTIVRAVSNKDVTQGKIVTTKKGNDLWVLMEVGGYAGEPICEVTVKGKTYTVSLKLSLTAHEKRTASTPRAADLI
jgi:hypothetical protein